MDKILGCKEPYRGDPEKRFEFVKSFGSGGFGTVELCKDKENNNRLVIRKLAKIEGQTMNEIAMLYHIRHKYIIRLYDYYLTKIDQATIDRNEIKGLKANTQMYGMVIEFGEGGDLLKYISERLSLEEIILLKIIDQSAQALKFLNENRTMHRDIKPENILLDKYGDIKLADFGTGDVLQEDSAYRTFTQQTGTQIYMAPEIKAQHKYYTYAIDVYSLGVSIYRGCRGNLKNNDLKTIDVDGLPEPIPDQYSSQFSSLVKKMLAFDENDRATLTDILETIHDITTTSNLTESDQNLLDSSLKLFYGTDGVINKEEAIQSFQKLVNDTNYECAESDFQLAQCFLYGDTVQQDNEQAIKLLRMAARKIHCPALKTLAFCYQYGVGVEKDLFTTVQLLTIARRKDSEASFLLGSLYFDGKEIDIRDGKWDTKTVVKKDLELAFYYFYEAKHLIPAQNSLGVCYMKGKGVQKSPYEAYKYLSSAADSSYVDALFNLSLFYLDEKENDQIYIEKAIVLLTEAASQYHLGASSKLAELYNSGTVVPKDEQKHAFYSKINANGADVFDSLYSFALLKLKGLEAQDRNDSVPKNEYEAFAIFTLLSANHVGAVYRLGQCYRDGIGTKKEYEKAADLFERASEGGIVDATVDLALCFLRGEGRNVDKERAEKLMEVAMEQGSIYAARCIAQCCLEEDVERAMSLLRKASLSGDLESSYLLAKSIRKKGLEEMDFDALEEAIQLLKEAATKGHCAASYELAMILSQGIEIYADREKASFFFAVASAQNHPQATTELGKINEFRNNNEEAFKLYNKASNLGDNDGLFHLALCFLNGVGVQQNTEKARALMEEAAATENAAAKLQLGILCRDGIGGQKDEARCAKLFEEASNLGSIEAKVQLGKCLMHGVGVEADNNKAFRMFKQASDKKSTEGKYRLAKMYLKGLGVRKNPQEAILLFEFLVREKNYTPAMYELANCYLNGIGCDADPKKGVQTLKKAVKSGSIKAMNLLGLCYINGNGVKTNTDAAIEYFTKASESGHKEALENLNKYKRSEVQNPAPQQQEETTAPQKLQQLTSTQQQQQETTASQKLQQLSSTQKHGAFVGDAGLQKLPEKVSNIKLYKVASSGAFVHYTNLPLDQKTQKLPESSRHFRVQITENKNPRFNQRLAPAPPQRQRDRNKQPDRADASKKPQRRVFFGPTPPILQKSSGGRHAINTITQKNQHRV